MKRKEDEIENEEATVKRKAVKIMRKENGIKRKELIRIVTHPLMESSLYVQRHNSQRVEMQDWQDHNHPVLNF